MKAILLWIGAAAAFAQTAPEAGLAVYRRHCSSCHGGQAEGGRHAPNLTRTTLADDDLVRAISAGVTGTEMAAYAARLSPEDIRRVVTFLRSAAAGPSSVAGNAARGEALFWSRGGCASCHAVGSRGSRVGPDLSHIGRQRNAVYLRESLVAPGAEIARGFDGVTVLTRDGQTIRGVERALDDFSVVLQDFSGKVYSFDRAGVRSVARDTQSLMPDVAASLAPAQLDDLVAYLVALQ